MLTFLEFIEYNKKRKLNEMSPFLYPTRKELQELSSLSNESIEDGFTYLGSIEEQDLDIYENKETGAIIAGIMTEDRFYISLRITCEERSLYVKSMKLSKNRKHVQMLNTNKKFARQAIAKDVYVFVATHFDLVSDRIQYLGAKILWQSLAKNSNINIYVFDENSKDYLRDSDGMIINYNGYNIDENEIWGQENKHHERLLVAMNHELI